MKIRVIYFLQLVAVSVGTAGVSSLVELYTGSKRMGAIAFLVTFFLLLVAHVVVSVYFEFRGALRKGAQRHG